MDFNKIHHVAIICSNYEISKEFYVEKLGFEIIREIYREERQSYKLDLKLGESQIELFSFPNSPKRPSYPEACGLRHLAFEVDDIEGIIINPWNRTIMLDKNLINIILGQQNV